MSDWPGAPAAEDWVVEDFSGGLPAALGGPNVANVEVVGGRLRLKTGMGDSYFEWLDRDFVGGIFVVKVDQLVSNSGVLGLLAAGANPASINALFQTNPSFQGGFNNNLFYNAPVGSGTKGAGIFKLSPAAGTSWYARLALWGDWITAALYDVDPTADGNADASPLTAIRGDFLNTRMGAGVQKRFGLEFQTPGAFEIDWIKRRRV